MRLIDSDALMSAVIETLEKIKANPKMDNQEAHVIAAFHTVGLMIADAPTVEAVQVVRCKDCRWWCTDCMPEEFGWCDATVNRSTDEDWFCADGERRDDVSD